MQLSPSPCETRCHPIPEDKDTIVARLVVEREYLTPTQLDDALEAQRKARDEMSTNMPLLQVCQNKDLLTPDQAQEIRNAAAVETGEARLVAGYKVVSKLGQGGMGAVYKAESQTTGELVALKILPPSLATPSLVKRFEREAKIVSSLDHQHIVRCVEFGYDKRRKVHFCALELVEGEDFERRISALSVISEDEAMRTMVQLAEALQHAHFNGLVHRDTKPANIMVTIDGTAKLLDPGLARPANSEVTSLTQTGAFVGSPYYASPEQATGDRSLDIRSDIYSLGCTLYHMVTGSPPFSGATVVQVLQKHQTEKMPWPQEKNPDLSDGICQIIAKMMAKSPDKRYQEPKELLRDLHTHLEGGEPEIGEEALKGSSVNVPVVVRKRLRKRLKGAPKRQRTRQTTESHRGSKHPGGSPSWLPYAAGAGVLVLIMVAVGLGRDGGSRDRSRSAGATGSKVGQRPPERAETPAALQLAKIKAMRTPDLANYAGMLEKFPARFADAPEAEAAKTLLSEMDVDYGILADNALAAAIGSAHERASHGDFDNAASRLDSVASRFADGPWLKETGEAKIAAAIKGIEKTRAEWEIKNAAATLEKALVEFKAGRFKVARELIANRAKWPAEPRAKADDLAAKIERRVAALAAAEKVEKERAAILTEYDRLMIGGEYTSAVEYVQSRAEAGGKTGGMLRAAGRVARSLAEALTARIRGAKTLVGKKVRLRLAKGHMSAIVKGASDTGLAVATTFTINNQTR